MPGHAEKARKQHDVCRGLPSASLVRDITAGCCQVLRLSNYLKKADALFSPVLRAFVPWGTSPRPSAIGGKLLWTPQDDFKIMT